MKILLAHNFYGSTAPSGENVVYLAERDMLRERGHRVIEFTRHSDAILERGWLGTVQGALATPWNPFSVRALRQILEREKPDVLHVHNSFPMLSPAIYRAARGTRTATVLTLHNYRTFCAAGIPMRHEKPCTECLQQQSVWPALRWGCYRQSHLATALMALRIALHRAIDTWGRDVDAFVVLTDFQRQQLVNAGLPEQRMHVKPNFYASPPSPLSFEERVPKTVFLGRLSSEKGVHLLVEAWQRWGSEAPDLEIIGDGPEYVTLDTLIRRRATGSRIHLTGRLPFEVAQQKLAESCLLALPSLCFEGFPMAVREAFALGVPVAASRIGALPSIVADGQMGVLFAPGDARSLYHAVRELWEDPVRLQNMGIEARLEFEKQYTAERNHAILMEIYAAAQQVRAGKVDFRKR